jgi:hypothetical protein
VKQRTEDRGQITEDRVLKAEGGMWKEKKRTEF